MKRILNTAAAVSLLMVASAVSAVDVKPLSIQDKWSVVGVITSSKPENDVAVLRNNQTLKTYTITLGDSLPSEYSFVLTEIKRRNVVVSNGQSQIVLGFVDHPVEEEEKDDFENSVRFIDNYYRGLAESPIDLLNKPRRTETTGTAAVVNPADAVPVMPIRSFSSLSRSAESRFQDIESQGEYVNDVPEDVYYEDEQQEPVENFYEEPSYDAYDQPQADFEDASGQVVSEAEFPIGD